MSQPSFRIGEITLRLDLCQAFVGDTSVGLTNREFTILTLLAQHDGALSREEIYQQVWGREMSISDRSVDVFVRKLRRRLDHVSPGWRYIHTELGRGYRCTPVRADDEPA
jgi:DNA-binding response OmpR family regulator